VAIAEDEHMARGRFISYLRVSTAKQGASGLGLEAQRKAVLDYLDGGKWTLVAEVVEIETGKRADRPKLAEALALCRLHRATLVIAKLDRLARNVAFISNFGPAIGGTPISTWSPPPKSPLQPAGACPVPDRGGYWRQQAAQRRSGYCS
jgi:hypothetical protein